MLKLYDLTTEYKREPLGLDERCDGVLPHGGVQ